LLPWHDPAPRQTVLPPWFLLVLCPVLSLLAVIWHGQWSLPTLAVVEGALLVLSKLRPKMLVKLALVCFWQAVVVTGLYVLRYDLSAWPDGLDVSMRLILVFLPGMLTIRMVEPSALERMLTRILPANLAFVASCCLRFFPLLLTRIRIIHEAQVLRGAKVMPRELLSPRNWPDAVSCIFFPAIVQSIELATEIADSAKVRGFDMRGKRTSWPQENISRTEKTAQQTTETQP